MNLPISQVYGVDAKAINEGFVLFNTSTTIVSRNKNTKQSSLSFTHHTNLVAYLVGGLWAMPHWFTFFPLCRYMVTWVTKLAPSPGHCSNPTSGKRTSWFVGSAFIVVCDVCYHLIPHLVFLIASTSVT